MPGRGRRWFHGRDGSARPKSCAAGKAQPRSSGSGVGIRLSEGSHSSPSTGARNFRCERPAREAGLTPALANVSYTQFQHPSIQTPDMSMASGSAHLLPDTSTGLLLGADSRRWALRTCQAMVLLPLFWLMLLPEYVQGLGDAEAKSIVYRATLGPFRLVDLLLLAMIAAHAVGWASSRRWQVHLPREIAWPGIGFLGAIVLAMGFGATHGGTNLFFDWRALALGIGSYVVFALWLQTPQAWEWAFELFAGFVALRIVWMFAEFFSGGGDVLVGVRIPVFDGPTLSAVVFTA